MSDAWKPKMLPPMWVGVAVAALWALHRWAPIVQLLDGRWRLVGIAPIVVGTALALWGEREFARVKTGIIPGRAITTFVRSGPFRFTRNPMYLGMTTALTGVAMLFGSLSGLIVPLLFVGVIRWRFIRHEEAMLRAAYGDDAWREYASSTRRWL